MLRQPGGHGSGSLQAPVAKQAPCCPKGPWLRGASWLRALLTELRLSNAAGHTALRHPKQWEPGLGAELVPIFITQCT